MGRNVGKSKINKQGGPNKGVEGGKISLNKLMGRPVY